MLKIFEPITKYFKIKKVRVYDGVFGLHCKVTVVLLLACAIIVSTKEYFGTPIDCASENKDDKSFVSTYCWVTGTYIIPGFNLAVGTQAASVGVTGEIYDRYDPKKPQRIYQRYYPWIVLFLLVQAATFMTPAYLWKIWEGGRLQQMCEDLRSVFVPEEWNGKRKELLISYFSNDNKDVHLWYAWKFFFCELLNCIVCCLNVVTLNWFFSGFWYNYASALAALSSYDWELWNEASSVLFPKVAKCELFKYGSSGDVQNYDALCVLPLNMLNDKIFATLAIWLIFLTAASCLNLIYRIYVVCSRKHRLRLLRVYLKYMPAHQTKFIFYGTNIGDWFMLYQVGQNINPTLFAELAEELYAKKKSTIANNPS